MSVANILTVKVPVTSRDVLGHRNPEPVVFMRVFWFCIPSLLLPHLTFLSKSTYGYSYVFNEKYSEAHY